MLILIYTGELEIANIAIKKVSGFLQCPIIDENTDLKKHYLRREKAVMILNNFKNWDKYKIMNGLLIFIFSPNASASFYDAVTQVEKITYKVRFCNGYENLDAQLENIEYQTRPSWQRYFMNLAIFASNRSSCMKRSVGAILVKNKRILSTGFNGTPVGTLNCIDGGCSRCNGDSKSGDNLNLCVCLHAEESAIMELPREMVEGSDMYVTLFPCALCLKKIIQSRVKRVIYKDSYSNADFKLKKQMETCGIEVIRFEDI